MRQGPVMQMVARSDDSLADALRGFGLIGVVAALVIILTGNLIGAALTFAWALFSRTPLRDLGLVSPKGEELVIGVVTGVTLKIVMKGIVMPLLGVSPINVAYHYLAGNPAALPGMLFSVIVGAGFGEELIWRGFLFDRFAASRLRQLGKPATVFVTAVLFGSAHYIDQGLAGATQAVITGLVFGAFFAATGRLWLAVFAHATFDVTAVLLIYWNLESTLAKAFFRQ